MSLNARIDCGTPALLEFRGPDAVRFLNGQVTQDVRKLDAEKISLPSCVTDAKGRLQFRVWLMKSADDALWVSATEADAQALEARLTRYLIADDVEVKNLSGQWTLVHFTADPGAAPAGVIARESARFGLAGTDWWIPAGVTVKFPESFPLLEGDALEAFRIAHGVPAWDRELYDGLLPPEAGLDASDISYHKGCYIGQEVISRIKHVGKVNKRLIHATIDASVSMESRLLDAAGKPAGELTSVSPVSKNGKRDLMAYLKRGAEGVVLVNPDGTRHPLEVGA
jgi:folate-binding protein YgfZ